MKQNFFKPLLSAAAVAAALSGCTMIPKYEQPQVAVSETFKYDKAQNSIQAASLGWQDYFADPRLHRLIEIALERNTDLRTAALNAEALREQYRITRANLFPTLAANGNGARQRTAADLAGGRAAITESYSVGLGVSAYELDLFGKARSNNRAALESYFNSTAARDAVHLTIVASVAKAYFNEQYATAAMALSEKTLASYQKTYDLAKVRHKAGVISALDLRSQEAMIENAKANYAAAVRSREQARNALELLISQKIPDDLPAPLALSKQFKIRNLPAGLPSDLLLNRPDIIAAEHTLKAANANIGVARAAFFPTISLTSTLGFGSNQLSNLFNSSNKTWSYGGNLSLPIFDWGQRRNQLKVSKIEQEKAVVAYEAAVEGAFRDVADALVARAAMNTQYDSNLAQQKAYNERLRLTTLRYKHGVSSALDLLDAQRSSYSADTTVLSTQLSLLENLADLYKALGGGLKRYSTDDATTQQEIKAAKTAVQTSKQATAQ